jgi:hypothetical protein
MADSWNDKSAAIAKPILKGVTIAIGEYRNGGYFFKKGYGKRLKMRPWR